MKRVSVCLITIFAALILFVSPILAQGVKYYFPEATDGQISEAIGKIVPVRWLPSQPSYILIRTKEVISRLFQASSAKRAEFDFVLSGKRLKEAYLLLDRGEVKQVNKTLQRYSSKLNDVNNQLEKARSQNQDVTAQVAEMAEGFKNQEVLLFAISKKIGQISDPSLDQAFGDARSAFIRSVIVINNIMPGVKDRFKTVGDEEREATFSAIPTPSPEVMSLPASPSAKPRRIIY